MANVADINKLQQQVAKLHTQQQKRTDRVPDLKPEAEKVTCIIQPVYEKVRQALALTGMKNSEHISSKLVEN